MEKHKTCSFFGHREVIDKEALHERLVKELVDLIPHKYSRFLVGSHGEFDKVALSACLKYRELFDSSIKINVVLTNLSSLNKTNQYKFDYYKSKNCEIVFYDIEKVHFKRCISFSNKKMVDDSDLIICYVDMQSYKSGAKTAVNYALKHNKKVINLFSRENKRLI